MITEIEGKIILNQDKWRRVAKRGETPNRDHLDAYLKIGGAVKEANKKVVATKKAAKKTAKKTTKKKK